MAFKSNGTRLILEFSPEDLGQQGGKPHCRIPAWMSADTVLGVVGNCHLAVAPVGQSAHSSVRLKLKDLDVAWDEPRSYRSGSQSCSLVGFLEVTPRGFY